MSCLRPVHAPPGARSGRLGAPSFPAPRCMHYRPPGRSAHRIVPRQLETTLEADDGIVRIGRARGVRRSRSPPRAVLNVRVAGAHGKAANRSKHVSRTLAGVFAGWRTGLPRPVIVLQAGTAANYFGTGLILPFEIIYLHQARGFPTATAGLVLAAVMGTAA